jgi:large subunit ribosomal protein L22
MMQFKAKSKNVPFSPFKLRPLVDVVRGKSAIYALQWLATQSVKRIIPIKKVIESAAANAKSLKGVECADLVVKEVMIDQGRSFRYYKPGSMGKAAPQKRRFSHISVVLESKQQDKEA